jgi:hypothetical protein
LKAVKLLGQPALFVTSLNQKLAFVSQYSPDGQIQHTWTFLFPMTGLDVDLTSNIVYFARGNAPQVYELNLQSPNAKLVFAGEVAGAKHLGSLALDVSRKRLFLADDEGGGVFEFDLLSHKSHIVSSDFGCPQAIELSADAGSLYVADSSRKKIYLLDLKQPKPVQKVFATSPDFRTPAGLAFLDDGRLAVADEDAGAIFVFSKAGVIQSVFRQ